MSELTKQSLLRHADAHSVIDVIAGTWQELLDEEEQELCLETVYDLLANRVPKPENFSLLSSDEKAQHEIDVDMLLITIDFNDLGKVIFDNAENENHFWSLVGNKDDKKNKKIFTALFS
ncbi:MAG: hypothetical protein WBF77_03000 [Sulfurimonadaceae bacterium]